MKKNESSASPSSSPLWPCWSSCAPNARGKSRMRRWSRKCRWPFRQPGLPKAGVVRTSHVLGTVFGAEEMDLAPQIMARVLEVKVREGALVKTGQLLARLDEHEFQDAVSEARAAQTAAAVAYQAQRATTARDKRLFEVKAIAQEQWDLSQAAEAAASARLETAKQHLAQARVRLGYCRIVAPTNGVVARRLADPGDLAIPGKPLLQLVSQQTVRVRAQLPSEDFAGLHVGQPVRLQANQVSVDAVVARVFPAMGDSHLASFECDVTHPPTGFVSGATVGVDVQMNSADGLIVPADALLEGDNGAWVFAVDNGTVQPVKVEVLDRSLDKAAIKGGVQAGDAVIVAQPSRLMMLAAGTKVAEAKYTDSRQP